MDIWNIFMLLGGLAIFLFCMMEMNQHLTSIASGKMKSIMIALTKGRARGYLTGLTITIVNQSSSATTVLETALVGAGLMTFQQSLAVTLGAELGSTFLPQLVAFPSITKGSAFIIAVGFVMLMSLKSARGRHIALTVFSFGLLFMGMDMMSNALKPLRSFEPFIAMMRSVEQPIFGIVIGLLFTMIIQSSGATTGITIAMAVSGTISLEQAIPINLGAAVGTCITAILGSLTLNWEAKRTAYIHVFFQLIGAIWVFILLMIPYRSERFYIWGIKWFTMNILQTDSLARQIAMGFTFMPIINHLIVFPNLNLIVRIFNRLFPERVGERPFGPEFVKPHLVGRNVEVSLIMARKEIIRVAEYVQVMLREMRSAFRSSDPSVTDTVGTLDSKVDILHSSIIPFLAELSQQELTENQSVECINYLYIQNELESIGDVIDKNIMVLAVKKIEQNLKFSEEGFKELEHLLSKLDKRFNKLIHALRTEDISLAKTIRKKYKGREEEKYKELHIERLHQGFEASIATSSVHLDLVTYFSRIGGHIAYIADRLCIVN